jgi:predicted branched-subunit amino acid permease
LETRRCKVDEEIDNRVYLIYGLTDEEVAVVKGQRDQDFWRSQWQV